MLPTEAWESAFPGTAKTSLPCVIASSAKSSAPLFSGASTTTVATASPEVMAVAQPEAEARHGHIRRKLAHNGAAARKVQVGDVVIIASYALLDFEEAKAFKPWVIFPDTKTNKLIR